MTSKGLEPNMVTVESDNNSALPIVCETPVPLEVKVSLVSVYQNTRKGAIYG